MLNLLVANFLLRRRTTTSTSTDLSFRARHGTDGQLLRAGQDQFHHFGMKETGHGIFVHVSNDIVRS